MPWRTKATVLLSQQEELHGKMVIKLSLRLLWQKRESGCEWPQITLLSFIKTWMIPFVPWVLTAGEYRRWKTSSPWRCNLYHRAASFKLQSTPMSPECFVKCRLESWNLPDSTQWEFMWSVSVYPKLFLLTGNMWVPFFKQTPQRKAKRKDGRWPKEITHFSNILESNSLKEMRTA